MALLENGNNQEKGTQNNLLFFFPQRRCNSFFFFFLCTSPLSLKAQDGFAEGEHLANLLLWDDNKHPLHLAVKWLTISRQC